MGAKSIYEEEPEIRPSQVRKYLLVLNLRQRDFSPTSAKNDKNIASAVVVVRIVVVEVVIIGVVEIEVDSVLDSVILDTVIVKV